MIRFRGMTWRHERGIAPLLAASKTFSQIRPEVEMLWDARSLQDFEQFPLEQLADAYDLIMIDHPHLGTAVAQDLLMPLDDLLSQEHMQDQKEHSVGLSHASYTMLGRQWALAADAAAQIAVYREDLLERMGLDVPATWEQLRGFIRQMPGGFSIGFPLVPVHAFSCFFTLTAQMGGRAFWSEGTDVPSAVGEEALGLLKELLQSAHPQSAHSDPIGIYEIMCASDEIAYIPLIYGYSNYARKGFRPHRIGTADIPSATGIPRGSMIGGVGLAISSRCRHHELAAEFVTMVTGGEYQRTDFFTNGGQPGHRSAWTDPQVNAESNGFFAHTLKTLDLGSMRPRFDGYVAFQEQAGKEIREYLVNGVLSKKTVVERLNGMIKESRKGEFR